MGISAKSAFRVALLLAASAWMACGLDRDGTRPSDADSIVETPGGAPSAELIQNDDRPGATEAFRREQFAYLDRLDAALAALAASTRGVDAKAAVARRVTLWSDLGDVQAASMDEWPALRARVDADLQESTHTQEVKRTARVR